MSTSASRSKRCSERGALFLPCPMWRVRCSLLEGKLQLACFVCEKLSTALRQIRNTIAASPFKFERSDASIISGKMEGTSSRSSSAKISLSSFCLRECDGVERRRRSLFCLPPQPASPVKALIPAGYTGV